MKNVVKHGFDYAKGLFMGATGYFVSGIPIVAQSAIVPVSFLIVGELMKIIVGLVTAIYLVVKTVSIIKNGKEK